MHQVHDIYHATLSWFAVLAVAIVLTMGLATPARAKHDAKDRLTATSDVKPVAALNAKESQAVSLAAGRILHHADLARQDLIDKKKEDALKQIDQGLILIRIIERQRK